jgi:branched-chain amino acid transport system substrate-binding protein
LKGRIAILAIALSALIAAGCGSSSNSSSNSQASSGSGGSSGGKCVATVGFEGPVTGPAAALGGEQLAFAKLAVQNDNKANGTNITLTQGDTQLTPSIATTVTRQFTSNSKIVAVNGPAGSQEVQAVGPLFARAGLAFLSGSATNPALTTSGRNTTFFRVVDLDSKQGPEDANFVIKTLHPKSLMIVDDQEVYSTGLVSSMIPVFQKAGVKVDHESVNQKNTDFSSLVAKVTPQTTVVVLPWQIAPNGQQFGKNLAEQHKKATIVGTDGMFSPSTFTIAGSYVSSFGPDITAIPSDAQLVTQAKAAFPKFGTFGPPVYAAQHVIDEAIASACKSGGTPSRSSVLSAIKATNEPSSILGQPIKFDPHGDLIGAKWFLFKIDAKGKYNLVPGA